MATLGVPLGSLDPQQASPSHQPTNQYTSGLPAPPRILIPPPALTIHSRPFAAFDASQPSLTNNILSPEHVIPGALQDWKYESRREAQQILPHLWLGPLSAAKNADFIRANNITMLLAVRSAMTARARLLAAQLPDVRYESIDVTGHQELIAQFHRASELIDEHYLAALPDRGSLTVPLTGQDIATYQQQCMHALGKAPRGGTTLLFCESGNERSAAVAAAYIMQHLSATAVQSIQIVQGKRFCVCFDDASKWLLSSYEPIWQARRVSRMHRSLEPSYGEVTRSRSMKRSYDSRQDDEENGMETEFELPNQGHAPFSDDHEPDTTMS